MRRLLRLRRDRLVGGWLVYIVFLVVDMVVERSNVGVKRQPTA